MNANTHAHTPTLNVVDGRGVQVREVSYLCNELIAQPQARIKRSRHDLSLQVVERHSHSDVVNTADFIQTSSLSGAVLLDESTDAGWRLSFFGEAGQTLEKWDSRGSHWQMSYDNQLRPTLTGETSEGSNSRVIERLTYAASSPEYARHNQCGRLVRHDDPAGSLFLEDYDLTGNLLRETRRLLNGPQTVDWPAEPEKRDDLLESGSGYTTRWQYAPTGGVLEQKDARGHTQRAWFDVAGQLKKVTLQLNGTPEQRLILDQVHYNAQGQITSQTLGGKITHETVYTPENGRVLRRNTSRVGGRNLQTLRYGYDPVGNVLSVEDHSKPEQHNANQRITPVSTYVYDSLYQLIQASGREEQRARIQAPLPAWSSRIGDRSRLLNFTQHYSYDVRGNLIKLRHQREGNNYTREMRIAPGSNRALPWDVGDPEPDFAKGFDANGNLQALQAGQPLEWNARNQLQRAALIERDDGNADAETYLYGANGQRVRKRQTQKAHATTHVHDVLYLPGLEIRVGSKERLDVVTVNAGAFKVRCLHWSDGLPESITNGALRYTFDDHPGSTTLELDAEGQLISEEGYYPFGTTAWRAARDTIEAKYRTVRYSGKERDASGLYYYGYRYYAPWLQRWISPDPTGIADGLNLYCMVGNNPIRYVDRLGTNKEQEEIKEELATYPKILSEVQQRVGVLNYQLYNSFSNREIYKRFGQSMGYNVSRAAASMAAGTVALAGGPIASGAASIATSLTLDTAAQKSDTTRHLPHSLLPQASRLDPEQIEAAGRTAFYNAYGKGKTAIKEHDPRTKHGSRKLAWAGMRSALSNFVPLASAVVGTIQGVSQVKTAQEGLSAKKIERLNNALHLLDEYLAHDSQEINKAFNTLGVEEFYPRDPLGTMKLTFDIATNRIVTSGSHSIKRADMQRDINTARATIQRGRELLFRHQEYNRSRVS
ncbi:RHS repeat-associated core domain protein containing protein [Pseudomonas sp. GM18]|uniref:RHS repeat domain-containing protein n=1 Tax=Pseudomonas sp. GM18 TaxID=1144324 RepID=UPI0002723029|nr:RHS repeat-associated core domain-containing protein [Pseudomonas sp. GM18]EJM22018.1 RHS repeat-associated core domain protein containing protein [Pseudomonas sp. GM18]